jgi:hypothetical protein
MKRYRWLKASWPLSMRSFAKRLQVKRFDETVTDGFVVDRVRDDFVDARYVERLEYDDTVVDPFGRELSIHRLDYRQCEFRASTEGPGIELIDAPRAIQTMVSRLAEVTDFRLSISQLSVDPLIWAQSIQTTMKIRGVVDSIQIGSLELSAGVDAKVVIRSSTDALGASAKLVEGKKHLIEKLQLRIPGSRKTVLVLSRNGSVRIDSDTPDELLPFIRDALTDQVPG